MTSTTSRNFYLVFLLVFFIIGVSYCFQNKPENSITPANNIDLYPPLDSILIYEKIQDFFLKNPSEFNIDHYFPFSKASIKDYKYYLSKYRLGRNSSINWTIADLKEMELFLDWDNLLRYANIPLTDEFLTTFKHHVKWEPLVQNPNLREGSPFFNDNLKNIIRHRKSFAWTPKQVRENIEKLVYEKPTPYATRIQLLSKNEEIIWSAALIEDLKEELDWIALSSNPTLPWSPELIDQFADKWVWVMLSQNKGIQLSDETIIKYEDKWEWKYLTGNSNLQISNDLLKRFESKWDWESILANPNVDAAYLLNNYTEKMIPYSLIKANYATHHSAIYQYLDANIFSKLETLLKNDEKWQKYSRYYTWSDFLKNRSRYSQQKWDADFLEKNKSLLDWQIISGRDNIDWSADLIAQFSDYWYWQELSANTAINWNIDLIRQFENKIDWQYLNILNSTIFSQIKDQLIANNISSNKYWRMVSKADLTGEFATTFQDSLSWENVFLNLKNAENRAIIDLYRQKFKGTHKQSLPTSFFKTRENLSEEFILNHLDLLSEKVRLERLLKPYVDQNMVDDFLKVHAQKVEEIHYFVLGKAGLEYPERAEIKFADITAEDFVGNLKTSEITQVGYPTYGVYEGFDFIDFSGIYFEKGRNKLVVCEAIKKVFEKFKLPPGLKIEPVILSQKKANLSQIFYRIYFENGYSFKDFLVYEKTAFEKTQKGQTIEKLEKGAIKSKNELIKYEDSLRTKDLRPLKLGIRNAKKETVVYPYDVFPCSEYVRIFMVSTALKKALEDEASIDKSNINFSWRRDEWYTPSQVAKDLLIPVTNLTDSISRKKYQPKKYVYQFPTEFPTPTLADFGVFFKAYSAKNGTDKFTYSDAAVLQLFQEKFSDTFLEDLPDYKKHFSQYAQFDRVEKRSRLGNAFNLFLDNYSSVKASKKSSIVFYNFFQFLHCLDAKYKIEPLQQKGNLNHRIDAFSKLMAAQPYKNLHLSLISFAKFDLENIQLNKGSFEPINDKISIKNSHFESVHFGYAVSSNAMLKNVQFDNVLFNVSFDNASIDTVVMQYCHLKSNLQYSHIKNSQILNMKIDGTLNQSNFRKSILKSVIIQPSDGYGSDIHFNDCQLSDVQFIKHSFTESSLENCVLDNVTFKNNRLHFFEIKDCQINKLTMEGIDFQYKTEIKDCEIKHSTFSNQTIPEVFFDGNKITNSNFTNTEFVQTTLNKTSFENCQFENATFKDLDFQGVKFINCDLTNTKFLTNAGLIIFENCIVKDANWFETLKKQGNQSSFTLADHYDLVAAENVKHGKHYILTLKNKEFYEPYRHYFLSK